MKTTELKRLLGAIGLVMCLSTALVGCSSEMNELESATEQHSRSAFETFIDIAPELIETGLLYTDGQEFDRYIEALSRFDSYVEIENGLLKYNGGRNEELRISEFLFELFISKMECTNKDIQNGRLVIVDGNLYSSASLKNMKYITRKKTRSESGWTPGRLDGGPQEIGQTILDAMKQIFYISIVGGYVGKLGDYVDLYSYNWSQGNASLSGQFTFNGKICDYLLRNPNAAMNNTGFNELSSIDYDANMGQNIYQIYVKENKYQSRVMTITTHNYETFLELKQYIGYGG